MTGRLALGTAYMITIIPSSVGSNGKLTDLISRATAHGIASILMNVKAIDLISLSTWSSLTFAIAKPVTIIESVIQVLPSELKMSTTRAGGS